MNKIIRYFDLNYEYRAKYPQGVAYKGKTRKLRAWPQWLTLLAGIVVQPYISSYRITGHWNFSGFWGWFLFSTIVAFAIFPTVYRRAFDASKPLPVLLAPIFTSGLGWEAIFGAIVKLGGG